MGLNHHFIRLCGGHIIRKIKLQPLIKPLKPGLMKGKACGKQTQSKDSRNVTARKAFGTGENQELYLHRADAIPE